MNGKKIEYLIEVLRWVNETDGNKRELILNQLMVELDVVTTEPKKIRRRG
jgi:hypothetical protein